MEFCSLHTHTTFSVGDGYGLPIEHFMRAKELGIPAVSVTDHGNVTAMVKAAAAARETGVKYIPGLEAYVGPNDMVARKDLAKMHQVMIAKDAQGYTNLMRLVERSWSAEGFYGRPTVTPAMMLDHPEGLIVTSGCLDGPISALLQGRKGKEASQDAALRTMRWYQSLYGANYYLEVQRFPQLAATRTLNAWLGEQSRSLGIPLLATADVHTVRPEDKRIRPILHAVSRNTGTVDATEAAWEYDIPDDYPESDFRVYQDLVETGLSARDARAAINSTTDVAEACNVELPQMESLRFPYERFGARSEEALLRTWLNDGWAYRLHSIPTDRRREYRERIEWEIDQVRAKGFLSYFLSLAEAIRWAKGADIKVGPGRGSGAASLLLWLLRVSEVDPMPFGGLMRFDRFIAPDRDDLPDVDIDFETERRDEVRLHCVELYGADRVGNVQTYTMYRAKNSIDKIGMAFKNVIPHDVIESLKDMLDDDDTIEAARSRFPTFAAAWKDYPDLEYAEMLEGQIAGFGIHAAGVVIGADALSNYVASYTHTSGTGKKKKRVSMLSVDKYDGEALGLLKYDFLGLKNMSIIGAAADAIGISMDEVYALPLDDEEVLQGFRDGHVGGIFQFEGATTRDICVELQPQNFLDLAHINALSRPGPLHGGSTADFLDSRHGRREREVYPPVVEAVLGVTEGEVVYQEQVIALAIEVAGFTAVEGSKIRQLISKKKGAAAFEIFHDPFVVGCGANGVSEDLAEALWSKMITAGGYAFNVAHAVSYSVLAYWCMWFRVHHPLEFFWARLSVNASAGKDAKTKVHPTERILKDMANSTAIELLPLDPSASSVNWTIEAGALRPGFWQIPGVGEIQAAAIVEARDQHYDAVVAEGSVTPAFDDPFTWPDLIRAKGIGPKIIDGIVEWASSDDPFDVHTIRNAIAEINAWIPTTGDRDLQRVTHHSGQIPYLPTKWEATLCGRVQKVRIRDVFDRHLAKTGKPLDPKSLKDPHIRKTATIYLEDGHGAFTIFVNRYAFDAHKERIDAIRQGESYVVANVSKSDKFQGRLTFADNLWSIDL